MFPKFAQGLIKKITTQKPDEIDNWHEFQSWYSSALGQRLLDSENDLFEKFLPDLFGYFLLQCGCPETIANNVAGKWLASSRVSSRICLDYQQNQGISCRASLVQLPIQSDSIDIVVLPHVLEFSADPHQVLREVERVLITEGHVIILGFNPWSLWNMRRRLMFWAKQPPWNAQFLAATRVMDWLALLGFEVVQRQGYFYRPPIQKENVIEQLSIIEKLGQRFWPNFGAGYALVARKRMQTLTPIRPRWRTKPRSRSQIIANGLETMTGKKCE